MACPIHNAGSCKRKHRRVETRSQLAPPHEKPWTLVKNPFLSTPFPSMPRQTRVQPADVGLRAWIRNVRHGIWQSGTELRDIAGITSTAQPSVTTEGAREGVQVCGCTPGQHVRCTAPNEVYSPLKHTRTWNGRVNQRLRTTYGSELSNYAIVVQL